MTDTARQNRMRNVRKVVGWFIGLGVAYALVHSFASQFHQPQPGPHPIDPKSIAGQAGHFDEQQGVMTTADYDKLDAVRTKITTTGHISDTDFSWTLGLMNRPLVKGEEPTQILHVQVMDTLLRTQFLTQAQRNRIYMAAVPMANTKSQSGLDKIEFATVEGTLHDPRGVPILKKLAKDPRPAVGKAADMALDSIQVRR